METIRRPSCWRNRSFANLVGDLPKLKSALANVGDGWGERFNGQTVEELIDCLSQVQRDLPEIASVIAMRHSSRLSDALWSRKESVSAKRHALVIYLPAIGGKNTLNGKMFEPDKIHGKIPGLTIAGLPVEFRAGGRGGRLVGLGLAQLGANHQVVVLSTVTSRLAYVEDGAQGTRERLLRNSQWYEVPLASSKISEGFA